MPASALRASALVLFFLFGAGDCHKDSLMVLVQRSLCYWSRHGMAGQSREGLWGAVRYAALLEQRSRARKVQGIQRIGLMTLFAIKWRCARVFANIAV